MPDRENYELFHYELVRKLAPECMVLLKSDKSFPLREPCKIALFGSGARHTLRGGTGGGIVEVKNYTTIEQGLKRAGFDITSNAWLDGYDEVLAETKKDYRAGVKATIATEGLTGLGALSVAMPEPDYDLPLEGEGEVAVYVLARASGEGADRNEKEGDVKLLKNEIRDIKKLSETYCKFLLVLNVSGVVDLSPVVETVQNIFLLSQTGIAIGDAFADVLLGKSYPSGKLASTWAAWENYSKIGGFGDMNDTRYREGIYVGYRYFDSVNEKPLFPFGYGMSFTSFSITCAKPTLNGSTVLLPITVKNCGDFNGKEVVQLYVSVPEEKLDQPYQSLAAFHKTQELAPNQTEKITLSFDLRSLASFDTASSCRVLEKGEYILRVGNSSKHTQVAGIVVLDQTAIVEKVVHAGGSPDFIDWKPKKKIFREDYGNKIIINLSAKDIVPYEHKVSAIDKKAVELVKTLSVSDLAHICTGYFGEDHEGHGSTLVPGAAGQTTDILLDKGLPCFVMADGPAGLHVSRVYGIDEKGIYPAVSEETKAVKELLPPEILAYCLKLFPDAANENRKGTLYEQNCTALPIETAIAQSWNTEVCESCGEIAAWESVHFNVRFWLSPALNIHRNILCGRNFEYFSEDPLVSGKMAAAVVKGAQKSGKCAATLKHFVCNEQETNRLYSNSMVSERALRDIYLRAFEIAVKEGTPLAVMSSYNLLNGEHTAHRSDILENVLRKEWGFEGMVMSDWVAYSDSPDVDKKYKRSCASGCIRGGTDLMMPGYRGHYENIMNAIENEESEYPLDRETLEKSAARIVSVLYRLKCK